MQDRILPQAIESERALIGGIFVSYEGYITNLVVELLPEAFYNETNTSIYRSILSLYDRNIPITIETVADDLRKAQILDKMGLNYLLDIVQNIATSAAWEYHKKQILDCYNKRKTIVICSEALEYLHQSFSSNEDALEKLDQHITNNYSSGKKTNLKPISETITPFFKELEKRSESQGFITGLDTGFIDLNRYTAGFQPSDLIILAARPSMGKSALALNIAYNISKKGKSSALFSLEMSDQQIVSRLISFDSLINSKKIRTGQLRDADWTQITHTASVLMDLPIYIDDSLNINITEMRSKLKYLSKKVEIDLVIIDYLQLMSGARSENRQLEISEYSRNLKGIAKDFNVPVLCLSQLNRKLEERSNKRPIMSDLRESGAIEQDADVIIFIYRDEVYYKPTEETKNIAEINIAKQRNGDTGRFRMTFSPEYTLFRDYTQLDADNYYWNQD